MTHHRISVREALGLDEPWRVAREVRLALRGDGITPPSRFGPSSLRLLRPGLSLALWSGRNPYAPRALVTNLFNRAMPDPRTTPWSVTVTRARDFRGLGNTYDSHNGTDFAVPPGTLVCAPAPGVVARVSNEYDRGGLKVVIDHGRGLITTANHLSRSLVREGQHVARGEGIARSGMSGVDGLLLFPLSIPHVHFNTWLDGEPVDPFGAPGEVPLWREGNDPRSARDGEATGDERAEASRWDEARVAAGLTLCRHEGSRQDILARESLATRAVALIFHANYYPARFESRPVVCVESFPRAPRLSLPFRTQDIEGVVLPEDRATVG